VLKVDKKNRVVGVKDDLHNLEDLDFTRDWDFSLPTIITSDDENQNHKIYVKEKMIKTNSSFGEELFRKFPFLAALNYNNILIAGGVVGTIVLNKECSDCDIDIFIYGLNKKKANQKIAEIFQSIFDYYRKVFKIESKDNKSNGKISNIDPCAVLRGEFYDEDSDDDDEGSEDDNSNGSEYSKKNVTNGICNYKFIRNKNCITMIIDDRSKLNKNNSRKKTIQIILRLYKTKSEILHGFDIGSSAIGFDGDNVILTTLGRFSYEYMCNIVDTTRRSTTYEKRLKKYLDRDFDIILPKLDITKLRNNYHKYNLLEVCEIQYFPFSYSKVVGNKILFNELLIKGYERDSDYQMRNLDERNTFYTNLVNLITDAQSELYYISYGENLDILNKPPNITSSMIINFYDNLISKIYNRKTFNGVEFEKYIRLETVDISKVLKKLYVDNDIEYLKKIIEKQKDVAIKNIEIMNNQDHSQLPWITENPTSQLTGSFNPIIEEESKWYGEYYLDN